MRDEQNIIDPNEVEPESNTIVLSKEQFKEFHAFVNIIIPDFKDLCIVNGTFRARSNDRSYIVETGFRYFRNIDFSIAKLKLLSKMLAVLNKNTEITITINDNNVIFTDGYQSSQVATANMEFIDNGFVTYEEMNEMFLEDIDADRLFIKETKPKDELKNINKMAQELNIPKIAIKHKEDDLNKGYIVISSRPGFKSTSGYAVPEYTIKLKEEFIIPMRENHYFSVSNSPLIFNKAEMSFNYYIDRDRPIIYAIYNTSVDRLFINIYERAYLIEDWII